MSSVQVQCTPRRHLVALLFLLRYTVNQHDGGAMFSSLKFSTLRSKKHTSPKQSVQHRKSTSKCKEPTREQHCMFKYNIISSRQLIHISCCHNLFQGCWRRCVRPRRVKTNEWCPSTRFMSPVTTRINVWVYLYDNNNITISFMQKI